MVNKFANKLLNGLLPHSCVFCKLPSGRDIPLCRGCEGDLPRNHSHCERCAIPLPGLYAGPDTRLCGACQQRPPPFTSALVPWRYGPHFGHLIQRWKFHRDSHLTPLLATLWLSQQGELPGADCVVPVPLHWRRRWQRGFNQSELLCRELLRAKPELGRLNTRLVRRCRHTPAQSGINATERAANLRGAFTVDNPCDNLQVALVDDVMTTGATASALAQTLLDAGAARVDLWCIARTPTPGT